MFLTVQLSAARADALVVPEEALVPEQGNVFVFVVRDGTRREAPGTHRASAASGEVEIVAGLAAGEQVVTEGTQKLRDGAPVTVQARAAPARAVERAPTGRRT